MGFLENIKNNINKMRFETAQKEKGKNLFLLGKKPTEQDDTLIWKGYEKAKLDEERRQISLIKMQQQTEKLKLKQKLDREKLENEKIKNKIRKEKPKDDFGF